MNMTGTGGGAPGRREWHGAGATSLTCNPRKFSEKIALHTQRQAEDIAAFREIMMDITSTRIQAQKVRHARSLASYYGGSLPNVNQISACITETQNQILHNQDYSPTQQHARTEHGQRDHRPSTHGRPNRRHTDSAPYLSSHLSPPSGPSWRRNWSSRSVNEKSQMDQAPVTTLNRTRSDSALHTSIRMTYTGEQNSAQIQTAYHRRSGGTTQFPHPVPLIEENVQEEGRPLKLQKMHSTLSGCDTSGNNISISGSLPDLSSLCLPSAVPETSNPELHSHTDSFSTSTSIQHLPNSAASSAVMTDRDLPLSGLSSCLLTVDSNPLFESSLSNPNLQTTLSSHPLRSSLSSASLCPSLSSSSMKSSLSSQSLQSCFSSSSLSSQSVQSTASSCSYSSGIGESRSCSSSSLSCSPRACGQVTVPHAASSRRRTPLSPLMVPSEESLWQLPKQFSPTMSTPLSSITQGMPLDTTKVPQEVKPSTYPYSQLPHTKTPLGYRSSQSCPPDQSQGWDVFNQNAGQMCQQSSSQSKPPSHYMQHEYPHCKSHQQMTNMYNYTPQQQIGQQTKGIHQYQQNQSNQMLLQQLLKSPQTQQYLQQQTQQYPTQHHIQPVQPQQRYQHRMNPQQQLLNHNQCQTQYQSKDDGLNYQQKQHIQHHTVMAAQDEDTYWQNPVDQHTGPSMTLHRPPEVCLQTVELPELQTKKPVNETGRQKTAHRSKVSRSQKDLQLSGLESTSVLDDEFELPYESYTGLHLTPSQAEALSQKLGQLQKLSRMSDSKCQDVEGKDVSDVKHPGLPQTQTLGNEGSFSFTSIDVVSACLDDEISDLQFSVPEFDLESFALAD